METFSIVLSGFVISFTCMVYLFLCPLFKSEKTINNVEQLPRKKRNTDNWLNIVLFSTCVFYGWCLFAIGLRSWFKDDALSVSISILSFALAVNIFDYSLSKLNYFDKMESIAICIFLVFAAAVMILLVL